MKIAAQEKSKTRRARPAEQMILFAVASRMFAIAAASVQEIRSTDSLAVSANEIEHSEILKVRHTLERSHQIYYVVIAATHFVLPVSLPTLFLILLHLRLPV